MDSNEKARKLVEERRVKLVHNLGNSKYYEVEGDTEKHSVIHKREKWMCDCRAFSVKLKCSHVDAARIFSGEKIEAKSRLPKRFRL